MRSFLFLVAFLAGALVGHSPTLGREVAPLSCPAGASSNHALQKAPLRPHWLVTRVETVEADWCERNGVRNGTYLGYRTGHRLAEESYYQDGKLDGKSRHFDGAGNTIALARFKEGKLDGAFVLFYGDGTVRMKGRFAADVPDGTWTGYYPSGSKAVVFGFDSGVRVGPWRTYDQDGRQVVEVHYHNGTLESGDCDDGEELSVGIRWKFLPPDLWKKEGLEVESPSAPEVPEFRRETLCCPPGAHQEDQVQGDRLLASECRNGTGAHGPYIQYYEDGTVKAEGAYLEGKAHGRTVLYHPNGQILAMGMIQDGSPCGIWRCFGADGRGKDCPLDLVDRPACPGRTW